jgi:putative FmdB family regulatory protein
MPLYDFQCRVCGNRFEALVRLSTAPECPACHGVDLERLLSSFAVSSAERQRSNADKSRKDQISAARRDSFESERAAEQHRRDEH